MKYMFLIPYTEPINMRPEVVVKFIEAASLEEVGAIAEDLASNARRFAEVVANRWFCQSEPDELDIADHFGEHGFKYGSIEVWNGEDLVWELDTDLGPGDGCPDELSTTAPPPPLVGPPFPGRRKKRPQS